MDVERFGSPSRTDPHRLAVRDGLYRALRRVFRVCGIPWARCHTQDTGDGLLVLAPAQLPKALFAEALPAALAKALRQHNAMHGEREGIRLRMALHAGEVSYDKHGVAAAAVNLAFRLLDAPSLKAALARSPGILALITSAWFFDEVIKHAAAAGPASYRPVRVTIKETSAIAWMALPDHPYPPDEKYLDVLSVGADRTVPRQLPAAHTPHFAGRVREMAALTGLLDQAATAGTIVISAIGGTAGIGKTALALRWAHQVVGQFPDGQLYVNLRGFDPAGPPVRPAEALHGFLGALGVDPGRIPVNLEPRAALYRSLLAGRRVLVRVHSCLARSIAISRHNG